MERSICIAFLFSVLTTFLFFAVITEIQQNICTTNTNCIEKHINTVNINNGENDINNPMKYVDSNVTIFSKDCDNKHNRVKAVNHNVTVSCDNGDSYKTVNSNITINNSTNDDDPGNNILFSCDNDKDHNINSTINTNNSANNTDFDKIIFSYDNEHGHNAINDENDVNNPKKHVNSDNSTIFPNDCDNNHRRIKAAKLNVTFTCDNDNSYKTIDGDINTNNSTDDNELNNNILLSCDNDRNSTNIDFDNNVIFSYGNDKGCKTADNDVNTNNSTDNNDPNNILFPCNNDERHTIVDNINANNSLNNIGLNNNVMCDNDNGCGTVDSDINTNNFVNSNSYNNITFSCDNDNNSASGVVLNNVMMFPYDDDNTSSILNDLINAKTSMNYNDSDNNIIFSCDADNTINNIGCVNITNTSEYLPSASELQNASEITVEKETIEHESIHNNISTTNDKNSSESLIDISSVNTFGCREDNLHISFSQSKGLQKKNFCYYCKKFQSKIARHLENMHKLEPEVKKFLLLPKGDYIF